MKEFIDKLIDGLKQEIAETKDNHCLLYVERSARIDTLTEVIDFVNQLAEEYKGEELRKSQKIYSFIKREINPYGKPFEGTVYEFGLKVMKYITNLHTEEYKPKTNADRIRSMTDEELAEFLDSGLGAVCEKFYCEECNNQLNCDVCYLKWLQSEAEWEQAWLKGFIP